MGPSASDRNVRVHYNSIVCVLKGLITLCWKLVFWILKTLVLLPFSGRMSVGILDVEVLEVTKQYLKSKC